MIEKTYTTTDVVSHIPAWGDDAGDNKWIKIKGKRATSVSMGPITIDYDKAATCGWDHEQIARVEKAIANAVARENGVIKRRASRAKGQR